MTAAARLSLAALVGAALAGRAHAQPVPPVPVPAPAPAPAPAPVPPAPPPPVEPAGEVGPAEQPAEPPPSLEDQAAPRKGKHHGREGTDDGADDAAKGHDAEKGHDDRAEVKAKDDGPEVEVGGRVFGRFTAFDDEFNPWAGGFSLDSARVQVNYRWKKLSAEVSFEVRGSVRDAYLDLELSDCLTLRAGRFKLPASAIERTSTWTLPTIDRPLGSDVLANGLAVTGRRSGVQLTWKPRGALHPRLEVAVGQELDINGDDLPRSLSDAYAGLTVTVRGELRPVAADNGDELRLGVFGQNREVNYSTTGLARYWTGGIDAEVDLPGVGLRVWADAVAGTGHFARTSIMDDDTPFVAAQAVIGWRQGGADRGKRFVEPFASFSYVNPTTEATDDVLTETKVGVAGGRWKRWRAQLQFAYRTAQDLPPVGVVGVNEPDPTDRKTVTAQLGTSF